MADHFVGFSLAFKTAQQSHKLFHQNYKSLVKQFHPTIPQAKQIISACPDCQLLAGGQKSWGANPQGLEPNQIWQTDMTHYPFGR